MDREIAHTGVTRLEVVETMHERKALMAELADAFVALPGGAGTLEELFVMFTWGQLGLHAKPIAILDVDGFFEPIFTQLTSMSDLGYLDARYLEALGRPTNAEEFVAFVEAYRAPPQKWGT